MSRLVRLYPAAWRKRYEAEFNQLLRERPVRWRGSVDVLLGAIDAHLHPEVHGVTSQPWTHRLPGLLAMAAGLIWSWFFVRVWLAAPDEEWGESIGLAIMLMFVALPGDYMTAYARRIGALLLGIAALMVLGRLLPWNVGDGLLNLAAGGTAWLLVGMGLMTLAAIRAGIGARGRWLLIVGAVLAPTPIVVGILGGFGPGDSGGPTAMLFALLPYGIAWMLVGLRMAFRGSATIVDPLPTQRDTEVPAT